MFNPLGSFTSSKYVAEGDEVPDLEPWKMILSQLRRRQPQVYAAVLKAIAEAMHTASVQSFETAVEVAERVPLEYSVATSHGYAQRRVKNILVTRLGLTLEALREQGPVGVVSGASLLTLMEIEKDLEPLDDEEGL